MTERIEDTGFAHFTTQQWESHWQQKDDLAAAEIASEEQAMHENAIRARVDGDSEERVMWWHNTHCSAAEEWAANAESDLEKLVVFTYRQGWLPHRWRRHEVEVIEGRGYVCNERPAEWTWRGL